MVNEFKYKAETFEICVDGKNYPVSTSKLILIQRMKDICVECETAQSKDLIGFADKIYECLVQILGSEIFNEIFKDKKYDLLFLTEFSVYLAKEAEPHYKSITDRFALISKKYSKDNLNEPVDSQATNNG